jgi:hypothetical protein
MSATKIDTNNLSLCIPRVFPNITWKRVKDVFEELGLGQVDRVDMINKSNEKGEQFKRVFIHFKHWNNNKATNAVKTKLESGDFVKVVYDDPWFWKVYKSDAPKPVFEKKKQAVVPKKGHKVPRLIDGDEHPGSPTPVASSAASELAELKAMMLAQQAEMSFLRQQLLTERSTEVPKQDDDDMYHPCSPVDEPPTPTLKLKKPKLVRQTANSRGRDSPIQSEEAEE